MSFGLDRYGNVSQKLLAAMSGAFLFLFLTIIAPSHHIAVEREDHMSLCYLQGKRMSNVIADSRSRMEQLRAHNSRMTVRQVIHLVTYLEVLQFPQRSNRRAEAMP